MRWVVVPISLVRRLAVQEKWERTATAYSGRKLVGFCQL